MEIPSPLETKLNYMFIVRKVSASFATFSVPVNTVNNSNVLRGEGDTTE